MQDDLHDLDAVLQKADKDTLTEIVRQAETFLSAQLQAGIAADQRAITFASVVGAIAAVLLGGYLAAAYGSSGPGNLGWVVFPVVILLTASMGLAVWASRPTDWYYAGSNPRHWRNDVATPESRHAGLAGQAKLYARGIVTNRTVLDSSAKAMNWALRIALAGISIGVVITAGLALAGCL